MSMCSLRKRATVAASNELPGGRKRRGAGRPAVAICLLAPMISLSWSSLPSVASIWWSMVWLPTSKPSRTAWRVASPKSLSCSVMTKNVAGTLLSLRIFMNCGVSGAGPSSKVSATSFWLGVPRET